MSDQIQVINNEAESQFEASVDGHLAIVAYQRTPHQIIFLHTGVPPELEGRGIGTQLARTALEFARDQQLRVVPLCPFIAAYIRRHPEYQPLVERHA